MHSLFDASRIQTSHMCFLFAPMSIYLKIIYTQYIWSSNPLKLILNNMEDASSSLKAMKKTIISTYQTVSTLKEALNEIEVDYVEKRFRSEEGTSGISTDLFVS